MDLPITLAEARRQLRLEEEDASRDAELSGFVADAAAWVERYTGHILAARDVTEHFRGLGAVRLRAWPVRPDAAIGVGYMDAEGNPIVVTGARIDNSRRPARVLPPKASWPFPLRDQLFTVTVRAGYEVGEGMPGNMKRAMLLLIGAYDADREGGNVLGKAEVAAQSLCRSYRLLRA